MKNKIISLKTFIAQFDAKSSNFSLALLKRFDWINMYKSPRLKNHLEIVYTVK